MLERVLHPNGVVTYQSPLLRQAGVVHAFSSRIGGLSEGPFASLNLGITGSDALRDSDANVAANYRLLLEAIACRPGTLRAWVSQVHGRSVELIEREPENEYAETLDAEIRDRFSGQLPADALVCLVPEVLLSIRIADCVPILLASSDGRVVASIHAGWRGVVGNIAAKTVRAMREAAASATLVAAIGPCISRDHFEVGEEVAAEFTRQDLQSAIHTQPGSKPHIDLQAAVTLQLERAGVTAVDTHELCTFRDREEFFSHRRDRGLTGRMAAVIQPA